MRIQSRRGFILLTSYLMVGFLVTWGAVLLMRSSAELQLAARDQQLASAFQLAEAGVDDAIVWLRALPSPPAGTNSLCPFGGDPTTACTPTATPKGSYNVLITPDPNNPISYTHLYAITSIGQSNTDATLSPRVVMMLQAPSFARYAYFTNSERLSNGTRVWFTSNDHLRGPVHSNDQFNIAGSPIFDSQVTSTASTINYKNPPPTGGNNPQFNGGLSLGSASVQLPMVSTALRVAASSPSGYWYQGDTTITLQNNGTMLVTNAAQGWVNHVTSLPPNGAVFVNGGSAAISGTLHGQLTVGASADVTITSNIVYSDNPQTNPQSTDLLGLIAEQNVIIGSSTPYDLTIHASVMALHTSFTVANWWVGPPKGTLNVYGGIIQAQRGAVGTFSSSTGQKLSGYSKNYQYDTRFSNLAPPFFPTTGAYQEVLWQQTR